jgi:transcriptional regulator with XRE-family HTH domain
MPAEAVAERAGLTATEVVALEGGTAGLPDIHTLIRLASALGTSPDDLLEGIDWAPGEGGAGEFRID